MSPLSRRQGRRAFWVVLLLALALAVGLDLLGDRSVVRGLLSPGPSVREPVVPAVDDAVRELRKGRPPRP